MRKILIALCLLLLWGAKAQGQATNIYITQSGASVGRCSSGSGFLHNPAWFNTAGNWGAGAGQIGPGTTVLLCGTITTSLAWQGSGTNGNLITMRFDTGAKLSQPFCGQGGGTACMTLNGNSWWILDGGVPCGTTTGGVPISESTCNGIIEANNNGTVLANQNGDNSGLEVGGTNQGEIKNLDVRNIYVRTSTTDSHPNAGNNERPYSIDLASGGSFVGATNLSIHDGKVHDSNWMISMITNSGGGNISVYNEDMYNGNHGIAVGINHNTISNVTMHDDHFGSMDNWDDTSGNNAFHHDSFHGYVNFHDGLLTGVLLYNSLFDGNMGTTPTGYIFLEGPISGYYFNNLIIVAANQARIPNPINNCNNSTDAGNNAKTLGLYNNTMLFLITGDVGAPIQLCHGDSGTVDVRNNAVTLALTNNAGLGVYHGGTPATWDYNAYGNNAPGTQLFSNSSSCCVWTYAQWKSNTGFDSHSTAILATPLGLNTSTGVPNVGSPVIAAGTNLSGLGISALNSDRNGNVRPSTWTIGAFNAPGGGGGPATPTNISIVVVGP